MKDLLENKLFKICIGSIILIILIIVIIILLVGGKAKKVNATNLTNAAKAYYEKNTNLLPTENYDSRKVSISTLITSGYISNDMEGATCPSYVTVTNMDGKYSYTPVLMCNDGTTNETLVSKLVNNLVTSGSGLYNENGKYIFKGENPNNYVRFGESNWRIIGLDENDNIKMLYTDLNAQYAQWDNRYNLDVDKQNGINDYIGNEKSRIKEYLDSFFTNEYNIEKFTAARVSKTTKFNTCIGKADLDSENIDICSNKIYERISTITIEDYINASLDSECNIKNTKNCQNYNFLNMPSWTITGDNKTSYNVYYIDIDEGILSTYAYIAKAIRPVIALNKDVLYVSGTGTETDPFMIR